MPRPSFACLALAALVTMLPARVRVTERPLDAGASASAFTGRSLRDAGLRTFLAEQGAGSGATYTRRRIQVARLAGPDAVLTTGPPAGSKVVTDGAATWTPRSSARPLLPLVLKGNVPGNEIERPMALVILGGLVTSTLLNLFLLPALYARFGGRFSPGRL